MEEECPHIQTQHKTNVITLKLIHCIVNGHSSEDRQQGGQNIFSPIF